MKKAKIRMTKAVEINNVMQVAGAVIWVVKGIAELLSKQNKCDILEVCDEEEKVSEKKEEEGSAELEEEKPKRKKRVRKKKKEEEEE